MEITLIFIVKTRQAMRKKEMFQRIILLLSLCADPEGDGVYRKWHDAFHKGEMYNHMDSTRDMIHPADGPDWLRALGMQQRMKS